MDNSQTLKRKYGLLTAICMVVGTVIGSGVFFKAEKVLKPNNGNMAKSLLSVALVGAIMIICSYVFSILARKYEKVNGLVDYAEAALGPRYAYLVGWFMTIIYYPTLTSCLAWVSAQYFCQLFGLPVAGGLHLATAILFLIGGYTVNTLSPKLAGYFQISTTFIKLIPIALMALIGTVVGLINGTTVNAMTTGFSGVSGNTGGILAAVVAFAFAYEGWIITTSINAELKDSKKNLPKALILGSIIVVIVYLVYFLGLTGAVNATTSLGAGPKEAFTALFGNQVFGTVAMAFVVFSCLGTMNGLMLGCSRSMYSVAARGQGPAPEVFSQVDKVTNMPTNSAVFGLFLCAIWLFQWQFGLIEGLLPAVIGWENDELPIITIYAMYIPIFIMLMVKGKELHPVRRFVMPILACLCCVFMVFATIYAYRIQTLYYFIVFAVIMLIGAIFYRKPKSKKDTK